MSLSIAKPFVLLAVALVLTFFGWSWPNRPMPLPTPYAGLVESVSFAPFRGSQSPLTGNFPSDTEIAEALDALVGKVRGIRLYTSREGMQIVPELARARGLKVFAGAWLGTIAHVNQDEVASLIELANTYPDTIDRVIVGNEVLLRRDLPVDALIGDIRRVKAAVKQPVTYADVWEFWLRNPQLAAEVDFITIHILPYWEDQPLPVEAGNAHVDHILAEVKAAFPGKPVVIGEIGWPTHGRDREAAVAGRLEQARFLTAFMTKARAEGIRYNVIEAFDQPWKSAMEGTVGANWGLFDESWQPKYDLSGPVVEQPYWPLGAAFAALVAIGLAVHQRRRAVEMSWPRVAAAGLVLAVATYAGSRAALEAVIYSYMPGPEAWALFKAVIANGVAVTLFVTACRILDDDRRARAGGWVVAAGDLMLVLATGLAFVLSFLMVVGVTDDILMPLLPRSTIDLLWPLLPVDGRYRDFPTAYLAIAALAPPIVAGLAAATGRDRFLDRLAFGRIFGTVDRAPPRGRAWFAAATGLGFLAMAGGLITVEGTANVEAWVWAACLVLLALPFAASVRLHWVE
ncbi:glycosyl hydrolase family 17 protein [Zavarzinia compransoris]|uniref:glycoside hydrolase family 17 protein n=1 Tax=Zavarzinia marina TaxID=2911065 RepID=UPI001F2C56EF|nr:glycosyl hydrolase family 17 protein [Zavarzinia marina]MCF4166156.1 glycosyl hydrolase family 17 protein [Zavarzinia marina]